MSNGKDIIIRVTVRLIKKTLNEIPLYKMIRYFLKPFRSFGKNINVKIDLSNFTAKTDLTNTRWYFKFCTRTNLASLKTEVDKLDIDKLAPIPVDLSKLSDVVKNDVFKKSCVWKTCC